jgi:hypothetical protein
MAQFRTRVELSPATEDKRVSSKQKIVIEKDRDVIAYSEMWHTSRCLLERGEERAEASAHQFRASLVFTAFTLEAYLNHVGSKVFRSWEDFEQCIGPKQKLNLIGEHLDVTINYGIRPWQIMKELFNFRNAIAHGKSENLKPPPKVVSADRKEPAEDWFAKTHWEAFGTQKNAVRARADVENLVEKIHEAAAIKGYDVGQPFISGMQTWTHTFSLYKQPGFQQKRGMRRENFTIGKV